MNLSNFTLFQQIYTPWSDWTASFQVGAGGVESISEDKGAVAVIVEHGGKRWGLLVVAGGYGWAEMEEPTKGKKK